MNFGEKLIIIVFEGLAPSDRIFLLGVVDFIKIDVSLVAFEGELSLEIPLELRVLTF